MSKIKVSKKPRYANCVSRLSTGGHIGTRVFPAFPAFRGRKAPFAPAAAAKEAVRASQDRGIQKAAGGSPGAQTGLVFSPFFAPGFKCAIIPPKERHPQKGASLLVDTSGLGCSQSSPRSASPSGSPGAQTGLVFFPFLAPGFKCAKIPNQRKVPREGVLFFGGHIGTRVFSVFPAFRESLWFSKRSDRARLFSFFCAGVLLHDESPIKMHPLRVRFYWWTHRDSNPRPLACEASALTS